MATRADLPLNHHIFIDSGNLAQLLADLVDLLAGAKEVLLKGARNRFPLFNDPLADLLCALEQL
ncbi:hypothetical protein N7V09_08960 [Shewanella seohaensis]|uniref:hypothetical protein n=1 Tax=Shewanella seohaensis TaxID=755175 RepID=UPI0021C76C1D|nr:hypothetical protein [Shewanella seohaensis]UXM83581.1 hypothetical protein N7V09_08960 [Shewanella seohaensis]